MGDTVWKEARKRARKETLDLIRLNDPTRAILTIGTPLVSFGASWAVLGQLAVATLAALAATLAFGLLIFLIKLIGAPAKIAEEARADIEKLTIARETLESLRAKRVALGQLISQAEHIKRDCASDVPVNEHMVGEWYERARKFLAEGLGEEYLHRFESSAGLFSLALDHPGAPQRNRDLWDWANMRATRLHAILEEMPTQPQAPPAYASPASQRAP